MALVLLKRWADVQDCDFVAVKPFTVHVKGKYRVIKPGKPVPKEVFPSWKIQGLALYKQRRITLAEQPQSTEQSEQTPEPAGQAAA